MIKKLFERIKYLESEIDKINRKNEIVAKNLKELFKQCKIEKEKKEQLKKELSKNLALLTNICVDKTFENGVLSFSKFLELIAESEDIYIVAVKLENDNLKNKFIYSYFIKNFNSLFSIKENVLIGVVEKKDISKLKGIKSIPFFNPKTEEMSDIELFKIVFEVKNVDFDSIRKIFAKFNELSNRPSFKNKHFIEYSLIKDRIVDFEKEEMEKNKAKYSYVYEEKFPDLELKLKQNIDNIPFVLALLERIDNEMDDIKSSRGIENVVNRILNYIEVHSKEVEIRKTVKILRESLKK
ncbi:hypothetical protein [Caminibacter sp.]